MGLFKAYIGIDYSGIETPNSNLKGLRLYQGTRETFPGEVLPPLSPRKYWTRRGIAEYLAERLAPSVPTILGIDHGFSFPLRYSEVYRLAADRPHFLHDFCVLLW